jgi:uridine kinase
VAALVIGVCGGTGSGKTTLTKRIEAALSKRQVVVLQQDYYYKDLRHLKTHERARQNYDHPDSVDMDLMVEHVTQLRAGQAIERPIYDFVHHCRDTRLLRVRPRPTVIVEGILVFYNKALRDLMDIRVFIDVDADLRFIRRLLRDVRERGRTVDSVVEQYLNTVRPMHTRFIEPARHFADIVIPEGAHNQAAVDLLIEEVRSRMEGTDRASPTFAHRSNQGSQ